MSWVLDLSGNLDWYLFELLNAYFVCKYKSKFNQYQTPKSVTLEQVYLYNRNLHKWVLILLEIHTHLK